MRKGIIYIATSKTSGKSYIGKTIDTFTRRINNHKPRAFNKNGEAYNTHFYLAVRKYGWDDFVWRILLKNIPNNKLDQKEIELIATHNTYSNGYNSTLGGSGHYGFSHKVSDKTRKKLSEAQTGEKSHNFGKHPSEETIKKMSESKKGKRLSQDTIHKIVDKTAKTWEITSPDGFVEIIKNLSEYCRNNGLKLKAMSRVSLGHRKSHRGYGCRCITQSLSK